MFDYEKIRLVSDQAHDQISGNNLSRLELIITGQFLYSALLHRACLGLSRSEKKEVLRMADEIFRKHLGHVHDFQ
jgi:hypothetical protein